MVTLKQSEAKHGNKSAVDESSSAFTSLKASKLRCGGKWNQNYTLIQGEILEFLNSRNCHSHQFVSFGFLGHPMVKVERVMDTKHVVSSFFPNKERLKYLSRNLMESC